MDSKAYLQAVQDAIRFAAGEGGGGKDEAWNGLFLLGLALAGLKLIESEPGTKLPSGYIRPPRPWCPDGINGDWSTHAIIVEHDFDPSVLTTQTIYN